MTDRKSISSESLSNEKNVKSTPYLHHQFSSFVESMAASTTGGGPSTSRSPQTSIPRLSIRAFLMNSPFSRRSKPKKTKRSSIKSGKDVSESSLTSASLSIPRPTTSIKRHPPGPILAVSKSYGRPVLEGKKNDLEINVKLRSSPEHDYLNEASTSSNTTTPPVFQRYMPQWSSQGELNLSESPPTGETKECALCLQEKDLSKFVGLLTCKHTSCLRCMKQYLIVEITESRTNISCTQCQQPMHPTDIHRILDNSTMSDKYEDFMLRRVLSNDPDTRWCPVPDCGYAVIATGCASCPELICERIDCDMHFCYHCKDKWHPSQTCDNARAERSRNAPHSNFAYTQELQNNDDVKTCPRCQVLIVKMDDGSCNHITCSVCSAEFCWLCMKEISDLHYLSPSGCTFWGKKPWSKKKKILWQLGTLAGAPLGIGLMAGLAVPAMSIGIPVWVGRKLHSRYANKGRHKRNLAMVGGITAAAIISPVLAGLAVSIGVPILLAYIYGVVPISLCRAGGCGLTTSGSCFGFNFNDDGDTNSGSQSGPQLIEPSQPSTGGVSAPSIGEMSCGVSLSAESGAHLLGESDRESASNTAIAPASLTGSIASSCLSRSHRLEVHADITHGSRSLASMDTNSLATSEKSTLTLDMENASTKALAGSLLHYKLNDGETSSRVGMDSVSGVMESGHHSSVHVGNSGGENVYIQPHATSFSETSSAVLNPDNTSLHSATDMRLDSVSAIITHRQLSERKKGVTFNECLDRYSDDNLDSDHLYLSMEDDRMLEFRTSTCLSALSSASNSVVLEMDEHELLTSSSDEVNKEYSKAAASSCVSAVEDQQASTEDTSGAYHHSELSVRLKEPQVFGGNNKSLRRSASTVSDERDSSHVPMRSTKSFPKLDV